MRRKSKSSLFLMELIIAILFFSVSAVICIQLFVASYSTSHKSRDLNAAVLQAQTAAEYFRSSEGNMELLCGKLPLKQISDSEYICYFDENGVFDTRNFSDYEMRLTYYKTDDYVGNIDICVYTINNSTNSVFTMTVSCNIPRTFLSDIPEVSEDEQ